LKGDKMNNDKKKKRAISFLAILVISFPGYLIAGKLLSYCQELAFWFMALVGMLCCGINRLIMEERYKK